MIQDREAAHRIIQISDFHLYQDPQGQLLGINTLDSFQNVLAQIDAPIDLLIGSGDLVHDGSPIAYQRMARLLKQKSEHVAVIPGNHDQPEIMQRVMQAENILFCDFIDLDYWQILLLNSHLDQKVHGYLDAEQLKILENRLQNNHKPALIFLHHQPVPVASRWIDALSLSNGDELMQLLQSFEQVKAVAWGHVHQEWQGQAGHIQLFAAPSTCIQFLPQQEEFGISEQPPGWREFYLHADGRIESQVHYLQAQKTSLMLNATGY